MLSLLKVKVELSRLARDWPIWSRIVAEAAAEILGDCEVYVFGSAVDCQLTGGSDVDILIVSDRLPEDFRERCGLKAKIEEKAELPLYHPFELHLVTHIDVEANPIYRGAISGGMPIRTKRVM
ncbi:MAG: nucleotidyltransferase domain-containing protein [Candidatus Bathyarchaeia archaeon]